MDHTDQNSCHFTHKLEDRLLLFHVFYLNIMLMQFLKDRINSDELNGC
ncbi:hypothetical protein A8990_12652 [Paenibacillus taihuensis]|uniref:Uncharacterized protein n=1 Tax=Paenibacillus taihuensis TaxID=1156355 RepID=A0A3D9RHI6_9BACL|nr:hypothetical protein A8990_12652 [Paenibacillus taihuensis]